MFEAFAGAVVFAVLFWWIAIWLAYERSRRNGE